MHDTHDDARDSHRAHAVFYPYGSARGDAPPGAAAGPHPGAAEVRDAQGRVGVETYRLERTGGHWLLRSQLFDAPAQLLARVSRERLPVDPLDAAAELLIDLWSLRHAGRLRFIRSLHAGQLGPLRWRRIAARMPGPPALEQALRAEGHAVRTRSGPIGTTEHILLLRRA